MLCQQVQCIRVPHHRAICLSEQAQDGQQVVGLPQAAADAGRICPFKNLAGDFDGLRQKEAVPFGQHGAHGTGGQGLQDGKQTLPAEDGGQPCTGAHGCIGAQGRRARHATAAAEEQHPAEIALVAGLRADEQPAAQVDGRKNGQPAVFVIQFVAQRDGDGLHGDLAHKIWRIAQQ